jgi:hypothetical protein
VSESIETLASKRLDALGAALRRPVGPHQQRWQLVVPQLGIRAADFRQSIDLLSENHVPSAMVVLRSLVDLTILTLWIERCPKLHVVLWAAEGDRRAFEDRDALAKLVAMRGRPIPDEDLPSLAHRLRISRANARYRTIARRAGVPIGPNDDQPLLPNVHERVQSLRLSAIELYGVGFGTPSSWAHTHAHTIAFVPRADEHGLWLDPDIRLEPATVRRFGIALQAGQLAAVSRMVGLGIEDELDIIRAGMVHLGS